MATTRRSPAAKGSPFPYSPLAFCAGLIGVGAFWFALAYLPTCAPHAEPAVPEVEAAERPAEHPVEPPAVRLGVEEPPRELAIQPSAAKGSSEPDPLALPDDSPLMVLAGRYPDSCAPTREAWVGWARRRGYADELAEAAWPQIRPHWIRVAELTAVQLFVAAHHERAGAEHLATELAPVYGFVASLEHVDPMAFWAGIDALSARTYQGSLEARSTDGRLEAMDATERGALDALSYEASQVFAVRILPVLDNLKGQ